MRWTELCAALVAAAIALPAAAEELRRVEAIGPVLTAAFEAVEEGDSVSIDLTLPLEAGVLSQFGYEGFEDIAELDNGEVLAGCPFGPLQPLGEIVHIPTGDNHFLLSLRFGDPDRHAANLASCEYRLSDEGPETVLRLRGCFHVLSISVPTARHLLLQPLPVSYCRGAG